MAAKYIVIGVLITAASAAVKEEDYFKHNHSEDYTDYEYDYKGNDDYDTQTDKPAPRYEVTEIVDDIPNNNTVKPPIVTNFTIITPLNNATVNDTNVKSTNKDKFKSRKNYISIFHVKAEYDDKPNVIESINKIPNINVFNGVKDHVVNFKDGVVNHIYNLGNSDVYNEVNNGFHVPRIVTAPFVFLGKLHRKGSVVANKLHNAIFGHLDDY